jgi:hypothetical protein
VTVGIFIPTGELPESERSVAYVFLSEFLFFYRGATNIGSSPVEI